MRILLVEDSERLQWAITTGLRKAGYAVDVAADGDEGLRAALETDYDVIVLDLMLPILDGMSLLRQVRAAGRDTYVLILTARDTADERVQGLRAGGDDYLVKPFFFDELLARIEALTRRRHGVKNPCLTVGGLTINTSARTVVRDGKPIDLAPREYALLEYLALHPGQVVSRTTIEAHIYDSQAEPMSNVVDVTVCSLRRKIDVKGEPSLIRTRRGMGYMLSPDGPAAGRPDNTAEIEILGGSP